MQEFTKDRYGVDVMKVEVPINMKFVEGAKSFGGPDAYTQQEAMDALPHAAEVSHQAVHLPVGRRQQRGVQRNAGARGRSGHPLLGRALRPRDLEGRHPDLRQAGRRDAFRKWLEERRREEHRQRQRAPEGRAPLVRVLRRQVRRRAAVSGSATFTRRSDEGERGDNRRLSVDRQGRARRSEITVHVAERDWVTERR